VRHIDDIIKSVTTSVLVANEDILLLAEEMENSKIEVV
jgi:hypothetical protein